MIFPLFGVALLLSAFAGMTTLGAAERRTRETEPQQHGSHGVPDRRTLVEQVRAATDIYRREIPPEYQQFLGCVSGPEEGAMGVHFVNSSLVDGTPEVNAPEALIYEMKNGRARLVGVEYIVPVAAWNPGAGEPPVPVLEGQVFHFNDSPNRFGLPPFYELHVRAWRDNPNGAFADWNTSVSCEGR
jgi:hypothetical protein